MRPQKARAFSPEPSRRAVPARRSTEGGNGRPTHEQVSQRAYEIYLSRVSAGDTVADWLQAEREPAKRE